MVNELANLFANQLQYQELAARMGLSEIDIENYESRVVVTRCDSRKFSWHHTLTEDEFDNLLKKLSPFSSLDFYKITDYICRTNQFFVHLTDKAKMLDDINLQITSKLVTRILNDVTKMDSVENFRRRRIKVFMGIVAYYKYANIVARQAVRYLCSVRDPFIIALDILYRKLTTGVDDEHVKLASQVIFIYTTTSITADSVMMKLKPSDPVAQMITKASNEATKNLTALEMGWTDEDMDRVASSVREFSSLVLEQIAPMEIDENFVDENDADMFNVID